jgi:hypothetical protein
LETDHASRRRLLRSDFERSVRIRDIQKALVRFADRGKEFKKVSYVLPIAERNSILRGLFWSHSQSRVFDDEFSPS